MLKNKIAVITGAGAGIGEAVLVATGSAARIGIEQNTAPIDAAIVGIIDDATGVEYAKSFTNFLAGDVYEDGMPIRLIGVASSKLINYEEEIYRMRKDNKYSRSQRSC